MADQNQQYRENIYSSIERYLNHELSVEERMAFESELNLDADLRRELDFHKDLHQTLGNADEGAIRKKLSTAADKWHKKTTSDDEKSVLPFRKLISIAAVLVFAVGFLLWLNNKPANQQYADTFEPYPMVLNQRSAADTAAQAKLITAAINAYSQKDFNLAANNFNLLSKLDDTALTYQFYEAVARLGNKEYNKASELFKALINKNDHLLVQQSRWYLAVTLKESGKTEAADRIFNSIKPGEYNYEQIK